MKKEELKIGLAVSFHEIQNCKVVGLKDEVLTIVDINFKHWGACNVKLSNGVYTNHQAIEIVKQGC